MLTFPTALFPPDTIIARLVGVPVSGGQSLSGITQMGESAGGGFWEFEFGPSTALWNTDKFNVFEAIAADSDGGAKPFIVPICERRRQPFGNPKRPPPVTFYDDSVFADGALWAGELVTATTTTSCALRTTRMTINFAAPAALRGGEHFTVWGVYKGQRMHRVTRVHSQGGGVADISFRPPLREAVPSGFTLDFDNPRCQMSAIGDMAATLTKLKLGQSPTLRFRENFAPVWAD